MKAISHQLSAFSKNVGTQDRTRENVMIRHNNDIVIPEIAKRLSGIHSRSAAIATVAALLIAPQATLAQNECGVQVGTTPVVCDQPSYPGGVIYDAAGDLVLEVTENLAEFGGNGIQLTGDGSEGITFDGTAADRIEGRDLSGALVDISTESGLIDIVTEGLRPAAHSPSGVTHGIRAVSDSGDIFIEVHEDDASGSPLFLSDIPIAIEATSGSGDVTIDTTAGSTVTGQLHGILAEVGGSGALTVNVDDVNRLSATTGTGLLTINAEEINGLSIDTGGDADINVGDLTMSGSGNAIAVLNTSAGTQTTLTHNNRLRALNDPEAAAAMEATGGGDITVNSNGEVAGFLDLSGHTGSFTWNIADEWRTEESSSFAAGNDTVSVAPTGIVKVSFWSGSPFEIVEGEFVPALETPAVMTFGAGEDRFVNGGTFVVGTGVNDSTNQNVSEFETEVRMEGLETFENSGLIMLGTLDDDNLALGTEGRWDDVLLMPGATFVGGEGSRIMLDVNLNGSQSACDTSLRDSVNFDMPAADCLGIQGGATEGVTRVLVKEGFPFDRGGAVDIVVVDVAGGTSGAGHFVLDEETPGYNPAFGGAIDKGIFIYPLVYDADSQQHILTGVPGQDTLQFPRLAQASHDLWRLSTATSLDRQADLRNRGEEDGGLWLRFANETTDGDITDVGKAGSQEWDFDNSFSRDSYAVTFGLDFLSGGSGDSAWVFGAMGGYANSDVTYDVSPNRAELNGWSLGAYGGYVAGPLWIDGAVNLNELTLRQHIPALDLDPLDTKVSNDLRSVGAQVDAGWRFDLTRAIFIEPLASISYVSTSFDTLEIIPDDPNRPGLNLDWDDPTSLRAGLGGRIGTDYDLGFMRGQLSLSAKVWNESDGESVVNIHNSALPDAPDAEVKQTFDDTVTEVTVGASVRSPGDAVSGFINLGGATSSDYDAFTAKLGVRYQW